MSRSIHTTRKSISEVTKRTAKGGASFEEIKSAALQAGQQLRKKRLIKRLVRSERRRQEPPFAGNLVLNIPIKVLDEGKFVHHAASVEDIRSVLCALPDSATEGITQIQLNLGKEYMDERSDDDEPTRDPFAGRLSVEILPGVFSGEALGSYAPHHGLIFVYAYVFDSANLPFPRPLCEFYLRLHALKTLVHEVAHHHDEVKRVNRGRWLADRKANVEWYAEKMEHQWTRDVVLPYLERTYPTETRSLRKWVAHRGGVLLPLEFFAGDNRRTERDGMQRLVFSTSSGFEDWVAELPQCSTLAESRLALAWELHYSDYYQECLEVLNRILATDPNHVPSLTCKADTLVHLENFDEAFAVAERALKLAPTDPDAWEIRGDVFENRADWNGLLKNCEAWEAAGKPSKIALREISMHRAIAHCALEQQPEMEAAFKALLATIRFRNEEVAKRRTAFARRTVFRRAGRPFPEEKDSHSKL